MISLRSRTYPEITSNLIANKHLKALRFYFLAGVVEGFIALTILFVLPVDPKNVWMFGFSKLRLLIASLLLIATGVHIGLAIFFGRSERHFQFTNGLANIAVKYSFWAPTLLVGYGLVIFVPYTIVTYPVLATLQGVQVRILPVMVFLMTRLVLTIATWITLSKLAVKASTPHREQPGIHLDPQKIVVLCAGVAGMLILASATLDLIDQFIGAQQFWGFRVKFDLDQEATIPSFFSTFLLLICAFLLLTIGILKGQVRDRFTPHWKGLALIIFFMAVDETSALHEKLINIVRNWIHPTGFFYYGWVIVAIPLVIVVVIVHLQFFFALPPLFKKGLLFAGLFYLLGAVGLEMIGAWVAVNVGENSMYDNLLITLEESLEMLGIIILIYTLLLYIQQNFQKLQLSVFTDGKPTTEPSQS